MKKSAMPIPEKRGRLKIGKKLYKQIPIMRRIVYRTKGYGEK
jgi:hypothetical protein